MKKVFIVLSGFVLAILVGSPVYAATEDTHSIASSKGCANAGGWYTNGDEGDNTPAQKADGWFFEGKDLIHHATGPFDLADIKGGSFTAEGNINKVVFKMETTAPYSTIVQTPDGKFWSSKVPAGKGSQAAPVTKVIDLTDADVIEQPGKEYTGATKVTTFGVGYWNEFGSTLVKSITFRGKTYDTSCKVATPTSTKPKQDCDAYTYLGTKLTLCDRFSGQHDKVNCKDVGFQVDLVSNKVDPWGLDGSGDNLGKLGIGCESYPLHPQPSHSSSSPAGTPVTTAGPDAQGPSLPVTGPSIGILAALGGAGVVIGLVGIWAGRRRRNINFTS